VGGTRARFDALSRLGTNLADAARAARRQASCSAGLDDDWSTTRGDGKGHLAVALDVLERLAATDEQ